VTVEVVGQRNVIQMTGRPLDTAHERWNHWWGEAKERARWREPEPAVTELLPVIQTRARRVLDVGTGIGRHALAYAQAGFDVVATDASQTGLRELERMAKAAGLKVETHVARFISLPLADASVDHVLAWNVLYHGDGELVQSAFQECRRVLRPGGTFQLTMLSKRHRAFGVGHQVRPDTYVDERSEGEKDHPHFYVDALALTGLLARTGFDVISLTDLDQQPPDGFHWVVLAEAARRP
jgi:tellurite methyltransferase